MRGFFQIMQLSKLQSFLMLQQTQKPMQPAMLTPTLTYMVPTLDYLHLSLQTVKSIWLLKMPEKRQKIYSVSSGYHLPTFCQQPNYLFLASTYSTCQEWIQWLPSLAAIPIALKMNKKTLMVRWATPPNYSSYLWTYITQDSPNIPSISGCSTCSVLLSL